MQNSVIFQFLKQFFLALRRKTQIVPRIFELILTIRGTF